MDYQSFLQHYHSYDFRPLGSLTNLVILALMLTALASVLQILGVVADIDLANEAMAGASISDRELNLHEQRLQQLFWLQIGILIITGILFINWIYRAYCNIAQFDSGSPQYSLKSAIWSWFVPFFNLYRPYKIAQEIWQKSVMKPSGSTVAIASTTNANLVNYWWTSTLVMGALDRVAYRMALRGETLDDLLMADYAIIGAEVFSVFAAFIAIAFVRELSARHERAIRSYQSPVAIDGFMQTRMS